MSFSSRQLFEKEIFENIFGIQIYFWAPFFSKTQKAVGIGIYDVLLHNLFSDYCHRRFRSGGKINTYFYVFHFHIFWIYLCSIVLDVSEVVRKLMFSIFQTTISIFKYVFQTTFSPIGDEIWKWKQQTLYKFIRFIYCATKFAV